MDQLTAFMSQRVTRRRVVAGLTLAGGSLMLPHAAIAAVRGDADLVSGLPKLDISVSDEGYEGIPATIEAGRYHVTISLTSGGSLSGFGGVAFMRPPDGMNPGELLAAYGIDQDASPGDSVASPQAEAREGGAIGTAVYEATYAGGTVTGPDGSPGSIVLDLTEGEWVAWPDEPDAPHQPVVFTVTGAFPDEVAAPAADVTVTMVDFAIELDGNLSVGDRILQIQNLGVEPHFLILDRYTGTETLDNQLFAALLDSEMTGASPPIDFDPGRDLQSVALALTQSTGTTTWLEASIEAGTYLAACFFPGAESGMPHAMMGMHHLFEVTG